MYSEIDQAAAVVATSEVDVTTDDPPTTVASTTAEGAPAETAAVEAHQTGGVNGDDSAGTVTTTETTSSSTEASTLEAVAPPDVAPSAELPPSAEVETSATEVFLAKEQLAEGSPPQQQDEPPAEVQQQQEQPMAPVQHEEQQSPEMAAAAAAAEVADQQEPEQQQQNCIICGETEGEGKRRRLLYFPNTAEHKELWIHLFCGKTAGILPNVNRPALETMTKASIKHKYGTGVMVTAALQKCRTAQDISVTPTRNITTEYYLLGEFEAILQTLQSHDNTVPQTLQHLPRPPIQQQKVPSATTSSNHQEVVVSNPESNRKRAVEALSASDDFHEHAKRFKYKPSNPNLSFYDQVMDHLQQVCDAVGGMGYRVVRGVATATLEGDYAGQQDGAFDPTKCSPRQVQHIRVFIITPSRQQIMDQMSQLLFSKVNSTSPVVVLKQSDVLDNYTTFQTMYISCNDATKFNMLLGWTETMKDHGDAVPNDSWLVAPHSTAIQQMLTDIAESWKELLGGKSTSSEDLGIDDQFTRPGVVCMLEQFRDESLEPRHYTFPFQ